MLSRPPVVLADADFHAGIVFLDPRARRNTIVGWSGDVTNPGVRLVGGSQSRGSSKAIQLSFRLLPVPEGIAFIVFLLRIPVEVEGVDQRLAV